MNPLVLSLLIAVMFAMVYMQNKKSSITYACPMCGTTREGEHHEDCSWKD